MDTTARTPPFGIATAVALLLGITACLSLPALPPWWAFALPLVPAAWWWSRAGWKRLVGASLFGFALCGLHVVHALSQQLPVSLERQDVVVSGQLVDLPVDEARRTRFKLRVDDVQGMPAALRGQLLQLSWYDGYKQTGPSRRFGLRAGSRWQFELRLRAPRGLRNPGAFDSEKSALVGRVAATGYVRHPDTAKELADAAGIDAWRGAMSARIAAAVPSTSSRYVRALALGDTRGLDDIDWETLRATGLTHLIAISGFHVGMVAALFALLASALWRVWPGLARRVPRPQAAALAALAGAAGYAVVAGFALPTVRTVLMIAMVVAARGLRRPVRVGDALAMAALAMLLFDPLAALTPGFWLSFAGVAWLAWCLPEAGHRIVGDFLSAQGVATLGLLPLTAVLFGQASLAGPLANLVAIPWWSLVVVPLSLLGTALDALAPGAGHWAWHAAAWCFDLSWPLVQWLAGSDFALWWLPEAHWFALPLALFGAFWCLLPRGVPGRALALLLWLPLLWPSRGLPPQGDAELVVLDVGQGLSVLVRTARHSLLYDMGPAQPEGFDAGERVGVPSLRALGVRRLDAAVVSHGDNDHAGGFPAVRRAYPVPAAWSSEGSGVPATRACRAGVQWQWDGVRFRFLHPPEYFPYLANESSCVLRIETAHGAALLTGDIGEVVERDLLRRDAAALRSEVVLVAHHGSGESSDPGFVAATGARHALVSSGYGNRFDHPRPEVVERWRAAGARVHDTQDGGALRVRLRAGGATVEPRRQSHPQPWDAVLRRQRLAGGGTGEAALVSYRPE
ncbi:DNA internalization-related competence protein ComEC/Rec2 [Luteimonas notoginsengisoli]